MRERRYETQPLPYEENLERFAPSYTLEKFTPEEATYLRPFFTNIDKPVFVIQHLPEEVIGALSSRYSRSTESLRRVFLTEYVNPILHPEEQEDWAKLDIQGKQQALETRDKFLELIKFWNVHGGVDSVVNIQRGRKFFVKWLADYGDDSIAELGGVHICIEGLSNIATKEIEDKRIGISPLEKSSRYVSFADKKPDGGYRYIVPGEITGTPLEQEYREAMDELFEVYASLASSYLDYIKEKYPKGEDETDKSFNNSRGAKRFDDLRDLLPFSTQTNLALYGNGRAFEDLVSRLVCHPLGEIRYWGQQLGRELERVTPSFMERAKTTRGAESQIYRDNMRILREELSLDELELSDDGEKRVGWAKLVSHTPEADVEILTAFLFPADNKLSYSEVRKQVEAISLEKRTRLLGRILEERKFGKAESPRHEVRFRKVPRAFENAHYLFEVWARGGDYRDLHRHRQLTQERQKLTARWGYDLEREVLESPFAQRVKTALEKDTNIFQKLEQVSPVLAQYAVAFGFIQHWYMNLSAREIYWIGELRTGPQARPHYKSVCLEIVDQSLAATPSVFQAIMVDRNDYRLARRESEKKIEAKTKNI